MPVYPANWPQHPIPATVEPAESFVDDLFSLLTVTELALENIENDTDRALRACSRLAARLHARNLQRMAQELLSWPGRLP